MIDHKALEKVLKVKLNNPKVYEKAFIHRSYVNENPGLQDNERLEFLGDAVLELATTHYLFEKFPKKPEGELTALRAALVRGKNLASVSKKLNLGQFLILSKGEDNSGGREKSYILANLCEAIIGAMYLDQGYKKTEEFIIENVITALDEILEHNLHIDAKTKFQELAQEKENITPEYRLEEEMGPDHSKSFKMGVYLEEEQIAFGEGSSKQKAEQQAAQRALKAKGWL